LKKLKSELQNTLLGYRSIYGKVYYVNWCWDFELEQKPGFDQYLGTDNVEYT